MPRPKKHKIQTSTDSLNHLLQEIYNECVEQRSTAILQRNKILKDINDIDDVQMVGKITNDLLKIIDLAIDKKLALAKLQASLVGGGKAKDPDSAPDLSTTQMEFLRKTLKDIKENKNVDVEIK